MNAKVLVIDDDAVIGKSFARTLTKKGYEVSSAESGEEGLRSIESTDYDAVFTDIKMPGIDGLEVTKRIKERCPWTPVVVITGYGTTQNEAEASVLGADGFVRKPLTPEIIESIALKAVSKSREKVEVVTKKPSILKNIALFFASPFIALGYIIALPAVGFYMFAKLGYEAATKK